MGARFFLELLGHGLLRAAAERFPRAFAQRKHAQRHFQERMKLDEGFPKANA